MKKYYLVYKYSFDSDFDNDKSIYILGLYDDEKKAQQICNEDFCKNVYYKQLLNNKELFIEL